jgi:hypothetical protein
MGATMRGDSARTSFRPPSANPSFWKKSISRVQITFGVGAFIHIPVAGRHHAKVHYAALRPLLD